MHRLHVHLQAKSHQLTESTSTSAAPRLTQASLAQAGLTAPSTAQLPTLLVVPVLAEQC